jgi:methylisocitrate lyase
VDAGADALFPEAMHDLHEFRGIRNAVDVPILANMTEFRKSDRFTVNHLQNVGGNMVIYPVTLLRSAMGAAERVLDTLKNHGLRGLQQIRFRRLQLPHSRHPLIHVLQRRSSA